MTDFGSVVSSLASDDPLANVTTLKNAVAEKIVIADKTVTIQFTDFFNHSFAPDLILSWPGSQEERKVYLRTSLDSSELSEDITTLAREKPIIMSLARLAAESQALPARQINEQSRVGRTLVTDPYGLDALAEESLREPVVSIFSHAVLQGGRGVFDAPRAAKAGLEIGLGFVGARESNAESTGRAVEASENLLDVQRASSINRLLQAVWIGSGGNGTTFPGASGVTARLDSDSLAFLLELPEVDDSEFWQRLARSISLETLQAIGRSLDSENLQLLLRHGAVRLQAKACRVLRKDEPAGLPRWAIRDSTLALTIGRFRVHYAAGKAGDLPAANADIPDARLGSVVGRAARGEVPLVEISLASSGRSVSYRTTGAESITSDAHLAQFEDVLGKGFSVRAATVRLGTERTLDCNYETLTAAGRTSARYSIEELTRVGFPMLVSVPPSELRALSEFLGSESTPSDTEHAPAEVATTESQIQIDPSSLE